MMHIEKTVLIDYSAEQMFKLVEQIEDYPQFLPWCAQSRVLRRDNQGLCASLTIDFKAMQRTFTTENLHQYPHRIDIKLVDGPFRSLAGYWQFDRLSEQGCKIHFVLDYEFSNHFIERLIGPAFGYIARDLIDSFVKRAQVIYGD